MTWSGSQGQGGRVREGVKWRTKSSEERETVLRVALVMEGITRANVQKHCGKLGNKANRVTCLFNVTVEHVLQAYLQITGLPSRMNLCLALLFITGLEPRHCKVTH